MSHRVVTVPRLHSLNNFNYFFHNTKRNLVIDQNFINNQYLLRKVLLPSLSGRVRHLTSHTSRISDNTSIGGLLSSLSVIENVASKVLTCQEPEAQLSQKTGIDPSDNTTNKHIPFKITPKDSQALKTQPVTLFPKSKAQLKNTCTAYLKLTKPNLTVLVTLSSICSYAISPLSVSLQELMFLTV